MSKYYVAHSAFAETRPPSQGKGLFYISHYTGMVWDATDLSTYDMQVTAALFTPNLHTATCPEVRETELFTLVSVALIHEC